MALTPATNKQVPEHSILDHYNKQTYLGNKFVSTVTMTSSGTTEVPILLMSNTQNGTGTGKSMFVDLKKLVGLTASDSAILRCYINPTVTGAGTPATPTNLRPANANTSVATVATAPSVSANGTLVDVVVVAPLAIGESSLMVIVDPTQTLLVTVQCSAASTATTSMLSWYEL